MRIPTHCGACGRFELVKPTELRLGEATCAECGSHASALPGESYAESDRPLFDGFANALREAGVDAARAAALLEELGDRRKSPASNRIQKLVESRPALGHLEVIALRHSRRKAEGVLVLLLGAIANRRSKSGFLKAVKEESGLGEKAG